jgi:hypothetical protein
MRTTFAVVLFIVLAIATGAAEARESSRSRIHPDRRSDTGVRFRGDRSYTTPGTTFRNDLRGYGGIHPDYRYDDYPSYGTPWWAVPGDPYANSFSKARPHYRYHRHDRYNYRPNISLHYDNGDWDASLTYNNGYPYNYQNSGYSYGNGYDYVPAYPGPNYYDNGRYTAQEQQPQVYNDNRVYNYYNDSQPAPQPAAAKPSAKLAPTATKTPRYTGYGRQFKEELRMATPDGSYVFAIRKGVLYAGLESGKAAKIASGVDTRLGGYAVYTPGIGVSVIYLRESTLNAAYHLKDGWHLAPLSHKVDTRRDTTLGMVGGQPWLVFTATDGTRYVVSFNGEAWQEVGSGSQR